MRRLLSCLLLVALVGSLAACGSTSAPAPAKSSASSEILGIVVVGSGSGKFEPTPPPSPTPSQLPDGFGLSTDRPTRAVVYVKALSGPDAGRVVAQVQSGSDGIFEVPVSPGTYAVYLKSGKMPAGATRVTVRPGQTSRVKLEVLVL